MIRDIFSIINERYFKITFLMILSKKISRNRPYFSIERFRVIYFKVSLLQI